MICSSCDGNGCGACRGTGEVETWDPERQAYLDGLDEDYPEDAYDAEDIDR